MWLTYVLIGATLGLLMGWEKSSYGEDQRYRGVPPDSTKIIAIGLLALSIGSQIASVRGFFMVLLSSLGAYYLIKPLGQLLEKRFCRIRRLSPKIMLRETEAPMGCKLLDIDLHDAAGVELEALFFRGNDDRIIPIKGAKLHGEPIQIDRNGWVMPKQLKLPRNAYASIELTADDWSKVKSFRAIGSWANGVTWLVDRQL